MVTQYIATTDHLSFARAARRVGARYTYRSGCSRAVLTGDGIQIRRVHIATHAMWYKYAETEELHDAAVREWL